MIRPLTIATFLLACGSGLYLYQSKHEVQLLDRTIEKALRDTGTLREQSRLLSTEWNMLNDPERLRQFSDTYLSLKSINPAQYTSLADLSGKLPAPQVDMPTPVDEPTPVALETPPRVLPEPPAPIVAPVAAAVSGDKAVRLPLAPVVRPASIAAAVARPADARVAVARPASVEARPYERLPEQRANEQRANEQRALFEQRAAELHPQRGPEQRSAEQRVTPWANQGRSEVRTAAAQPPRPIVLSPPRPQQGAASGNPQPAQYNPAPAAPPYGGSLLGMARGSMPPVPRPTPVVATYSAN